MVRFASTRHAFRDVLGRWAPRRTIQVDMFEVQLGAALLLQFRASKGEIVRVLADAGIHASDYENDHVLQKLPTAFAAFGDSSRRLDLIIGTHYDADHLEGLVSIIQDPKIKIGEAWMPPVANDVEDHASDDNPYDSQLLAKQFAEKDGLQKLAAYLNAKKASCEQLLRLEQASGEFRPADHRPFVDVKLLEASLHDGSWAELIETANRYFGSQIEHASASVGETDHTHADDTIIHPPAPRQIFKEIQSRLHGLYGFLWGTDREISAVFHEKWMLSTDAANTDARNFAYLRRSLAKDAINATSLAKVVSALRQREVPIRCQIIPNGKPRRFVWQSQTRRFVPGQRLTSRGPEIALLGPSEGLVKKHWDRLPIGDYQRMLAFATSPIKSITPSNQLSYVVRFRFLGQGILVSGDAGCVDFKPKPQSRTYYQGLVQALLPLHVIQVAHHGGNNAHFYRVLLAAGFTQQTEKSFLLLSHATNDRYRPSRAFAQFVEQIRTDGDDMTLLFTCRPDLDKVRDFLQIVHQSVGHTGDRGDVRLAFNSKKWSVESHAISL